MIFALILWLAGCTCSGPSTTPADPAAAPAAPSQAPVSALPDDGLAYEYRIETAKGESSVMRVFLDGRVQMGTARAGGELTWKNDTPLTPAAVERLQAALGAPDVASLPAQLPTTPEATENSPNLSWVMRQHDGSYKRVTAERFAGMRVPALDAIHIALRSARVAQQVTTDWEVRLPDRLMRGRIPCHPAKIAPTQPVISTLNTEGLAPAEPAHFTPMLRIQWAEGDVRWVDELSPEGLLVRRIGGSAQAWQMPADQVAKVAELLTSFDVDMVGRLCR